MTTDRPHLADDPYEEAAFWATRLAEAPPGHVEQAQFEAWLAADPLNIARMENIVRSWEAVEAHAAAEPIMELRHAALASARASAKERSHVWHGVGWRAALAAASILIAVMGAGVWLSLQPVEYRTGIGERRVVTLADGSTISLDAGTAVEVLYTRNARELTIEQGRAKFVVAKGLLRPFTVHAGSKLVVATGTAFSVERLRDTVNVVLYEGHVALLDGTTSEYRPIALRGVRKGPVDRLLAPDQQVSLPAGDTATDKTAVATIAPADPVRSLAWENGQLIFNDEPLPGVVERINRYADRPLRLGDDKARGLRLSGVFRAGDTDALIQGLQAAFRVRVVQEPNAIAVFGDERPN